MKLELPRPVVLDDILSVAELKVAEEEIEILVRGGGLDCQDHPGEPAQPVEAPDVHHRKRRVDVGFELMPLTADLLELRCEFEWTVGGLQTQTELEPRCRYIFTGPQPE